MTYMTLLLAENLYFGTKHSFVTSNNTTSRYIGRTDAWAVPHLKFFWGTVLPTEHHKSPAMVLGLERGGGGRRRKGSMKSIGPRKKMRERWRSKWRKSGKVKEEDEKI